VTRPDRVAIREVGPRDGLQIEAPVPVPGRVALIEALVAAGVVDIEVAAFVSPRAVPAMAGAADVLSLVERRPGVTRWALVPNLRGARQALAAGVDGLSVTVSASEAYSQRNVGMSVGESVSMAGQIADEARGRIPVDAVISCALGSPFGEELTPGAVAELGGHLIDGGATTVTFADTTGMATPRRIDALLDQTGVAVGLHLHDTRARRWSTPMPRWIGVWPGSTRRSEAWVGRHSPRPPGRARRRRAAIWPPRTWCTCSMTWGSRRASI
jgi:hydroxymethylglutaryl-CoA lyase